MGCGGRLLCIKTSQSCYEQWALILDCANAAWQNPPAKVVDVFARVLQRDLWGLQQVVIACLSTNNQNTGRNPYLSQKSNYQYVTEAMFPDTTPVTDEGDAECEPIDKLRPCNNVKIVTQGCP